MYIGGSILMWMSHNGFCGWAGGGVSMHCPSRLSCSFTSELCVLGSHILLSWDALVLPIISLPSVRSI